MYVRACVRMYVRAFRNSDFKSVKRYALQEKTTLKEIRNTKYENGCVCMRSYVRACVHVYVCIYMYVCVGVKGVCVGYIDSEKIT